MIGCKLKDAPYVGEEVGRLLVSEAAAASASPDLQPETRAASIVACGTGVGVSIFASKFPRCHLRVRQHPIHPAACELAGGRGVKILQAWQLDTPTRPLQGVLPGGQSHIWPCDIFFLDEDLETAVN